MIKKVIEIKKDIHSDDAVSLSWFDMQKPNLSAITKKDISFIIKVKFTHLHDNDVLICEDGYAIKVDKAEDDIYLLEFSNHTSFANYAYAIGNRHQPIRIEDYRIIVLDDIALLDIIQALKKEPTIKVTKMKGFFRPNGKAHHSH